MAFWVFMLIMGLLIPLTMVGFGKLFLTKAPKTSIWFSAIER